MVFFFFFQRETWLEKRAFFIAKKLSIYESGKDSQRRNRSRQAAEKNLYMHINIDVRINKNLFICNINLYVYINLYILYI